MPGIKGHYQRLFGRSLREDVKKDTSGDYGKTLLKILDKAGNEKAQKKDGKAPAKKSPRTKAATQSNKDDTTESARKDKETKRTPRGKEDTPRHKKEEDRREKNAQVKKVEKEAASKGTKEDEDATKLYKAMSGMGTDEDTVIEVLVRNSNSERQSVKKRYKELYKQVRSRYLKHEECTLGSSKTIIWRYARSFLPSISICSLKAY